MDSFQGKKVLVMGLGVLGGGLATTRWFLARGAEVTVTDLRSGAELADSLAALGKDVKRVRFVLGHHDLEDFKTHDLVVANPAVPRTSPFLRAAKRAGKEVVNDARIFFDEATVPVVAVTGTRGKTTTANWVGHFLGVTPGGNSSAELPLLKLLSRLKRGVSAVVELSSWQLELVHESRRGPSVAVITNIYRDHLNRYRGMTGYAGAKANIFSRQTARDYLIVNADNAWTAFFLRRKPKAQLFFFSLMPLGARKNGLFLERRAIHFQTNGRAHIVVSERALAKCLSLGEHNLANLLAALLAAHCTGIPWKRLVARLSNLPGIPYREEVIMKRKALVVVNDSAGTSPDATIAALRRFRDGRVLLLAGGTDKNLEFSEWASVVERHIPNKDLFLLEGSATKKMVSALQKTGYFRGSRPNQYSSLSAMVRAAQRERRRRPEEPVTILFSPGAASFEKFKNEFDRGAKFTVYCRQLF